MENIRDLIKGSLIVGMGECVITVNAPLATLALGSCVAVIVYDPHNKIGGLLHAMLPSGKGKPFPKYLDYGIDFVINKIVDMGGEKGKLVSGLVGGGTIFNFGGELAIGKKNVAYARSELSARGIPLVVEEVEGRHGRSLVFDVRNGKVSIMVSKPPILRELVAIDRNLKG